ncbi:MAG: hypothetical protein HPM95_08695 [Alphaproteobacteria bacterium]|nr:hypothetical protein [Alphaproteobacteria bacterium]
MKIHPNKRSPGGLCHRRQPGGRRRLKLLERGSIAFNYVSGRARGLRRRRRKPVRARVRATKRTSIARLPGNSFKPSFDTYGRPVLPGRRSSTTSTKVSPAPSTGRRSSSTWWRSRAHPIGPDRPLIRRHRRYSTTQRRMLDEIVRDRLRLVGFYSPAARRSDIYRAL